MKRIIGLGIVAVLLLALPLAHTAMAKDHKVDICHFTGHVSDTGNPDFAITGAGRGCARQGGNVISVSVQGACNGHGVCSP